MVTKMGDGYLITFYGITKHLPLYLLISMIHFTNRIRMPMFSFTFNNLFNYY